MEEIKAKMAYITTMDLIEELKKVELLPGDVVEITFTIKVNGKQIQDPRNN